MRESFRKFVVVLPILFLLLGAAGGVEPNEPDRDLPTVKAVVIPCKDMIDDGLYKSIQRRTQIALDEGAEYLIYEIGTYGGFLKSGDDISKYFILEVCKEAKTVA